LDNMIIRWLPNVSEGFPSKICMNEIYCCHLWSRTRCQNNEWYAPWWSWLWPLLLLFLSGIASTDLMNYLEVTKTRMYPFKGVWIGPMRPSPQV